MSMLIHTFYILQMNVKVAFQLRYNLNDVSLKCRLNDPAFDLDEQRLNPVHTVVYLSRPIWLPKIT